MVGALKKIPVTVKVRKGYEDESGEEAVQIAKVAEASGIEAITIHGRTRAQGYTGQADWHAIGKVKKAVKIPVIGNGDVLSAADARRLYEISGCDGIMIGRGALGNPWIYKAIRSDLYEGKPVEPPTLEERKQTVLEHMELEAQYEGIERAVFHMRRIGAWYIAGIPNAAHWRAQLNRCQDLAAIRDVLLKSLSTPAESMAPPVPEAAA